MLTASNSSPMASARLFVSFEHRTAIALSCLGHGKPVRYNFRELFLVRHKHFQSFLEDCTYGGSSQIDTVIYSQSASCCQLEAIKINMVEIPYLRLFW
jgi:hypothetical protein